MKAKLQKWAFMQPQYSRHMSEYYVGILDFLKTHPEIILECFSYNETDTERLSMTDGFITYAIPPKDLMSRVHAHGRGRPPAVAITMRPKVPTNFACAHIDPQKVGLEVASKLVQRHCRSFAFCTSHTPFLHDETASLLKAFRQAVWDLTGEMPKLFKTTITSDVNLIPKEMSRFTKWFSKMPKPCGFFVHGDDVARKVLDTCRLYGIEVPRELRVIGTGNSAMYCERTIPTLSSYGVNHEKVGYAAAKALFSMIHDGVSPQDASFEVAISEVTERASTLDASGNGRLCDQAIRFIHDEIDSSRAPSIADIAHHLNVSRAKIQRDFLDTLGHTLHDELAVYRINKLAALLRASNEPSRLLFPRVGFTSVSQAKRAFRHHFGMTMTEYRRSR